MDNINVIEYSCPELPEYIADVYLKGCCKGLAQVGIYKDALCHISWDSSNTVKLAEYIKIKKTGAASEMTCRCISAIRKIIESVSEASDYLVEYSYIDLCIDNIYFDLKEDRAILLPGNNNASFFSLIIKVCEELNNCLRESSADIIADELIKINGAGRMTASEILSFLSKWEMELKGNLIF